MDECKVWKREFKRRFKDDVKYFGLYSRINGNVFYSYVEF